MSFELTQLDNAVVVRMNVSRLDANTSRSFKALIDDKAIQPTDRVVLDFEGVEFLDSSGLGALVTMKKHLAVAGQLVLCQVTAKPIIDIFSMTRFDRSFIIQHSVEQALASFK